MNNEDTQRQRSYRQTQTPPRKRPAYPLAALVLVALACLLVTAAGLVYVAIIQRAAESFGPPAPNLGSLDRFTYSLRLVLAEQDLLEPADPNAGPSGFEIQLGESVGSISYRLEQAGLVRSAVAFRTYLIYSGLDIGLQAGEHDLSASMPALQIAAGLQNPAPTEAILSVLPGWRAEEIAAALPTTGLAFSPEGFLALVNNPPDDALLPPALAGLDTLEGFMLPGRYTYDRGATAEQVVIALLQAFDAAVTANMRAAYQRQGLDLRAAVALASIVQREAVVPEEQPIIASVFYNRLAQGMKLDSDPTVQYALGFDEAGQTWWTNPLSAEDLQFDSPYNTYLYAGMIPAPIANPSTSALQAVAFPAQTPYYYFRARCDGSGRHNFAVTYEQHVANGCNP